MATEPKTRYTYADLATFPDDHMRREIIDGELIVTPAPRTGHQRAVGEIFIELGLYARQHGGEAFVSPTDVFFADDNVVEPDVLFLVPAHVDHVEERYISGPPDIVVEVSSPSTRHIEIVRKLRLYERFGVREYWYVDLQAGRIEIHRLVDGGYGVPTLLLRGNVIRSDIVPGFELPVDQVLGEPDGEDSAPPED
jgi:Uma2 family endonuclease